jgi:hypothetical protein
MEEVWKQITEYPNYSISNWGNVKNMTTDKILVNIKSTRGYLFVGLSKNGKRKMFLISRLVGEYFLDNFDPLLEIDHIDRNPQNNNITNLRCVNRSENQRNRNKWGGCTSKYKGVSFNKKSCKWKAQVKNNGKPLHLGYFDTEEDAYKKYLEWNAEKGYLV